MSKRKRLALIYGGEGEEHEVSLAGAAQVLPLINTEKYSVMKIKIEQDGAVYRIGESGSKTPLSLIRRGKRGGALIGDRFYPIAVALPLLHGRMGEDGVIQGLLRALGIPFVGCDTVAGAMCFDKRITKLVAQSLDIPTLDWVFCPKGGDPSVAIAEAEERIGYPLFVKPARQGSSVGASIAYGPEELVRAMAIAKPYSDGGILIEEALTDKRELEVAYLSTPRASVITPPGEILCHGTYGYREKYDRPTATRTQAVIPQSVTELAKKYTEALALSLGVRGLSRFDYFYDGRRLLLNEVNTMPGFTAGSMYPAMIELAGIDRRRLIDLLLESASC